ncbi:TonB-dependent receptor [Paraglaciecola polaris]|uniref:Outer membrane protein n=1 Tax=Paraglaciecola polaris LMG 21857 TaxID=1129793 RepID=K7AEK5_9ALTE|nr:TonB-dependent receptor [Paraglaciecola polaris]GAC33745.1 outer membrane protein [Paraglaciecola polaris LMG 21857]|tara:strand:+ start:19195 stop:21549 length:2355 start_codon:yes stop_codon:yes gene_type:complete
MKTTKPSVFTLSKLSLLVAVVMGNYAFAAEQREHNQIEEITVTAQKRNQSIQDVPVSISAYDGAFLERLGVAELDTLSEITPGLVIQEQSPNNPGFVIRGITSDSGSSQAAPRVSIYYNGADVSRSRGSYFELFDIERVEVVKGPQATLFGTAASVGALSVITRKPQEEFSAQIKGNLGNYSAEGLSGFVTGGNSQLQGRLAFSYRQREGFIRNIAGEASSQNPDGLNQEDMHGIERTSFRPSLRFTPHDDVTVDLVYTYEKNDDTGTSFKNGLYAPTGGNTSPYSFVEMSGSPMSLEVFGREDLGVERTVEDLNLTVNWDINSELTFTSITAGRRFDSLEVFDADGTQAWFLEFAEDATGDQFSQEFRLIHQGAKLTTIAGVSYFTEDGSQAVPFSTEESIFLNCLGALPAFGQPCISADGSVPILTPVLTEGAAQLLTYNLEFENYGDSDAYSAFVDVTYALNDSLELTSGLRYVREDKSSGYRSDAPNSVLTGSELFTVNTNGEIFRAEADYDDWLPRFNLLYVVNDDINMYATISKGRRSDVLSVTSVRGDDGLGERSVSEIPAEIIWNYETGIKGQAFDKSVNYNASLFYQQYSNFQVTLLDDEGVAFAADAGSATNVGVEAEVRALLGADFEMFANLAYLDATIDDDSTNGNLAGNRFRLQPEWTASVGMFYSTQLSQGYNLTSSLVYSYRSDVFFEPENAPISGLDISEDAVSLVSARIGIARANEDWSVSLFANNLLDNEYLVDAGNTGGGFGNPTFVAGPPRFYGVEFTMNFGEY